MNAKSLLAVSRKLEFQSLVAQEVPPGRYGFARGVVPKELRLLGPSKRPGVANSKRSEAEHVR